MGRVRRVGQIHIDTLDRPTPDDSINLLILIFFLEQA